MPPKQTPENDLQKHLLLGVVILGLVAAGALLYWFSSPKTETPLGLNEETKQAYSEAQELASLGDPTAGVERLKMELSKLSGSDDPHELYTEAKLYIYIADLYLSQLSEYEPAFKILALVYGDTRYDNNVRGEALMLAMAHAYQALDEEALTVADVRNMVFANQNFRSAVGISPAQLVLLNEPLETYEYFAQGFAVAMGFSNSEAVDYLAASYTIRLSAPFVPDPSAGEYYQSFIANLQELEASVDKVAAEYTAGGLLYQEFIAASYYNLARTYEALPLYGDTAVSGMARMHEKLKDYAARYGAFAWSGKAYLTSLDARIACRIVDAANFDAANIDAQALKPYLDELYENPGWVAPCAEAFDLIGSDIDPRFAS